MFGKKKKEKVIEITDVFFFFKSPLAIKEGEVNFLLFLIFIFFLVSSRSMQL